MRKHPGFFYFLLIFGPAFDPSLNHLNIRPWFSLQLSNPVSRIVLYFSLKIDSKYVKSKEIFK